VSCAERTRRPARFPLEIRAARTPDAPALLYRGDAENPPWSPFAKGGDRGISGLPPRIVSGSGTVPFFTMSFRELNLITTAVAQGLRARDVLPGERVGLCLAPGPAYPVLLLALLRTGAVAVPISTRLPPAALPDLLRRISCRRLIGGAANVTGNEEGIEFVDAPGLISTASVECFEKNPYFPLCQRRSEGVIRKAAVSGAPEHPAGPPLPPFDPTVDATIVFTSGSTGAPKAALHTFENHWSSAVGANRNIPLRPGDRWLLSLPPWHVGGLAVVFRCLLGGAAIAIAGRHEPLAEAISGLGATHVSLVATQLYRLLREKRGRAALRSLKAILLGGGPAPAALIEEAVHAGARLVTSYGSTEMASQATASRPGDPAEALRTAGRPLAFRQLSVAADGEILVRGRTLFRGYVEETGISPARDISGWFHSGDLGHLDTDGRLTVTGRRDTMFISGGENIHPEEIEREILRFPGVLEAVVVPVPDPEFGERPAAFLRTVDVRLPDTADIDRFLRLTLPGFKMPQRYLGWPDIEEGMKPDRRTLAILARDGLPPESRPEPAGIG
jgi:O-succinylbenzoic acid--CoA ligase